MTCVPDSIVNCILHPPHRSIVLRRNVLSLLVEAQLPPCCAAVTIASLPASFPPFSRRLLETPSRRSFTVVLKLVVCRTMTYYHWLQRHAARRMIAVSPNYQLRPYCTAHRTRDCTHYAAKVATAAVGRIPSHQTTINGKHEFFNEATEPNNSAI